MAIFDINLVVKGVEELWILLIISVEARCTMLQDGLGYDQAKVWVAGGIRHRGK